MATMSLRALLLASVLLAPAALYANDSKNYSAKDSATVRTNPGFNPDTGQINPGETHQVPSSSADIRKVPTPDEIRAALMTPDDPTPSLGAAPASPQSTSKNTTAVPQGGGGGDPTTATQGQAAIGGPMSPGASAGGGQTPTQSAQSSAQATGQAASGAPKGETTGHNPVLAPGGHGPIGATGQTMPSKFSQRNDVLDRAPIMALTPKLSDQDRSSILQAVQKEGSKPVSGADVLDPGSALSIEQALNDMHQLPEGARGVEGAGKLKYVIGKSKVLLVEPSTRIVVDVIPMS
jgi:hypothetical protein